MNIKQHIEAGHYPTDSKGRSLVPMANGDTSTILATDLSDDEPICGWDGDSVERWCADGAYGEASGGSILRLLPPSPCKVEVKAWGVFCDSTMQSSHHSESAARNAAYAWESMWKTKPAVVELTGSYEKLRP